MIAHDLGLGTVIAGISDHDKTKEILGVLEDHDVVALITLGYPAHDSAAPKCQEIGEFVHYEKF